MGANMRPSRIVPALLIAVAALSAACGSDDHSPESANSSATTSTTTAPTVTTPPAAVTVGGESVPVTRLANYAASICEAARQAATDPGAASKTFNGRAHDGLHLIARGLETVDRAAAATLLEAKQKVEADFSEPPPAAQLVADLNHLAEVTRSSLTRFGVNVEACPPA